jgi:ADP-dependent phosphofructokinase/glucokinase
MGFRVPATNRVIVSHDPANFSLRISKEFKKASLKLAAGIDCAVVSGFHHLEPKAAKKKLREASSLVGSWRKRNPSLRVHLELGDFASRKVLRETLDCFLPLVNSFGMNEMEAKQVMQALKLNAREELNALAEEVIVHDGEGSKVYGFNKRDCVARAALFGHALAGFKAVTGRDASLSTLKKFVKKKHSFYEFRRIPATKVKPKFTVGLGDAFTAGFVLVR